jgi:hypothetical protein
VSLGDSGLRLLRAGAVAWASPVQEHSWNCPYQLSHPSVVPQTDTAEDAAVARLEVERGDVLVLGTDGLWDNMWEGELVSIVKKATGGPRGERHLEGGGAKAAAALARALVAAAARNAGDPRYRGPWAVELEEHGKVRAGVGGWGEGEGVLGAAGHDSWQAGSPDLASTHPTHSRIPTHPTPAPHPPIAARRSAACS